MNDSKGYAKTGKMRVRQDPYTFDYLIEEEQANGTWVPNVYFPTFKSIDDAKRHFEKSKAVRKQAPAEIGGWDD